MKLHTITPSSALSLIVSFHQNTFIMRTYIELINNSFKWVNNRYISPFFKKYYWSFYMTQYMQITSTLFLFSGYSGSELVYFRNSSFWNYLLGFEITWNNFHHYKLPTNILRGTKISNRGRKYHFTKYGRTDYINKFLCSQSWSKIFSLVDILRYSDLKMLWRKLCVTLCNIITVHDSPRIASFHYSISILTVLPVPYHIFRMNSTVITIVNSTILPKIKLPRVNFHEFVRAAI